MIINSEASYMDADLDERVTWAVVLTTQEVGHGGLVEWRVTHTLGENDRGASATCIMREAIELDPWSYVKSPE
jgi:hypothetical protein